MKAAGIPGWEPWIFTAIGNGVLCHGAVCPPITRGPRKGQPNFRKPDPETIRDVVVTKQMLAALDKADKRRAARAGKPEGGE